jgi:hypothetical protein
VCCICGCRVLCQLGAVDRFRGVILVVVAVGGLVVLHPWACAVPFICVQATSWCNG